MRISVITVCLNSSATILDTLRSVELQLHPDIEHIVVDGASADGTAELIRRSGARVSELISERDGGIYDAMNKGLTRVTGEMVGFLNADDVFAGPDVVARIAAAGGDGRPDAVFGDMVYMDPGLARVTRHWHSGEFSPSRLRYGWMPPHPTFYARRTHCGPSGASIRASGSPPTTTACCGS